MDWNRIEGSWKQLEGAVKAQWGTRGDDDVDVIGAKRDQPSGRADDSWRSSGRP